MGHTLILLATLVTVLEIFMLVVQVLSSHTKEVDDDVAVVCWM